VVSLLPAATEIVCALGLRESLVGRSHECDFPPDVASLPALTKARVDSSLPSAELDAEVRRVVAERLPIYRLDEARLEALAPDVVVTQEACEVCAISYDQVVESLERTAPRAAVVSLEPRRLGDVFADVERVAAACGVPERGKALAAGLRRRLETIASREDERRAAGPSGGPPRVAVVEWLAPPMLAGHWVPETIAAAGGIPVGPRPGQPSAYTTWNEVRAQAPDAIVVAPCGFGLPRTLREADPFADVLRGLAPRVLLMDGNAYLNRPGPRIVEGAETIADWLRGEVPDAARALILGRRPARPSKRR
jgi:iron complex transport system substrate-binding protein